MNGAMSIILYILVFVVVICLSRFFTYLSNILVSKRLMKNLDPKALYPDQPPETREKTLEHLKSILDVMADYVKKKAWYRFVLIAGLIDGILVFFGITLQNFWIWVPIVALMMLMTFLEFMPFRYNCKKADALGDTCSLRCKNDEDLIKLTEDVQNDYRKFLEQIERTSRGPWKIFCGICIAAVVFLIGAQADYFFRAKEIEPGVWQKGRYQYRILDDETAEIVKYTGIWKKTRVPASFQGRAVTSIGEEAFRCPSGDYLPLGRKEVESVRLPDSLRRIGNGAFEGCHELSSLSIPDSVTWIGDNAFRGCGLTEIILPDSLAHIGAYAFAGCEISGIYIPDAVTEIGANPFLYCQKLESIEISENHPLLQLCGNALCDKVTATLIWCSGVNTLTSYTVPEGIRSIGDDAFSDFKMLRQVVLPESLESIGMSAFEYCRSLEKIVIPAGVTTIRTGAFQGCASLSDVTIPEGVTAIEEYAFANCQQLDSVKIPDSVHEFGKWKLFPQDTVWIVYPGSDAEAYCRSNHLEYRYYEEQKNVVN